MSWTTNDIPNLAGRVAVVTGRTAGSASRARERSRQQAPTS